MPTTVRSILETTRLQAHRLAVDPRTRRWSLRLLVFVLLFGLLGGVLAPRVLRGKVERELAQTLHRPVSLAKLSLNPYTLKLEAQGLRIGEPMPDGVPAPADAPVFLSLDTLRLRASWLSLPRLKPIIAELLVDGLRVNLQRRAPETFNISDLLTQFSAPDAAAAAPSKPLLFSVSNIRVEHGEIRFDDRVLNEQHAVEDLRIGIPFLANIPSKVEVDVQPLLEARIDGSPFSLSGQTRPFSDTLESTLQIRVSGLALPQLLAYSPKPLPAQLSHGTLSTDLVLKFARLDAGPQVSLSGRVDLDDLVATTRDGAPLLEAKAVHVEADDVQPLTPRVHLAALRIEQPLLSVSRAANGQLNLSQLGGSDPAPSATASTDTAAPASSALPDFSLKTLKLADGRIRFRDAAAGKTELSHELQGLELDASAISTLDRAPLQARLAGRLASGGQFTAEASAVVPALRGDARIKLDALALSAFQPYLTPQLNARIASGMLDAELQLQVDAAEPSSPQLQLRDSALSLRELKLVPTRAGLAPLELRRASLQIGAIDLARQHAEIQSLNLEGLKLGLQRNADGSLDLAQLLPASAPEPAVRKPAAGAAAKPWTWQLGSAALSGGSLAFTDRAAALPVALTLSELALKLGPLSDDLHRSLPIELSGRLLKKGLFSARGTLTPEPLQLAAALKASELDLAPLSPYLTTGINASIGSLQASMAGNASLRRTGDSFEAGYQGELGLANLRVIDPETLDGFLGFGTLKLAKLDARYGAAGTRLNVGSLALDRFFAQVLLDAKGQLNIGRVLATHAKPADRSAAVEAAAAPASSTSSAPAPPLQLGIDELLLSGGSLDYTDNFIKPNFRANLTDIGGRIGRIASAQSVDSPVDIKAKLNGSGPVAISGGINPLAATPSLDLTASASEIELTRFATYSTKYTGYPIVKGKLQVDLHYALRDGALNANNHIFIDQFTFGDRVESASATNLPVRLAISLLKNARGEIDLDVPVSGSLSDPQFNVGRLIWSALLNLIGKAVTSPFSLLASAFGGNADELGSIAFEPGSAVLATSEQAKLARIAQALADKPAVKLDLVGRADPASDGPALKQAAVLRLLRQQKLKDLVGRGDSLDADQVVIGPDEYDKYLARAYSAATIEKPRNALGIARTLPSAEMATRLADAAAVGDSELRALAEARADAVQQALAGQVSAGRVFVVAPRIETGDGSTAAARVDFTLKD